MTKFTVIFLLSFFWTLLCLGQDSIQLKKNSKISVFHKRYLKAEVLLKIPTVDHKSIIEPHAVSFTTFIQEAIRLEFGFLGFSFTNERIPNQYLLNINHQTKFAFNLFLLRKGKVRPYFSMLSHQNWYFYLSEINLNMGYQRGQMGYGVIHRNTIPLGVLFCFSERLLVDVSFSFPSLAIVFDNGYRYGYTKNPSIPPDQQEYRQVTFYPFLPQGSNLFRNPELRIGLLIAI